MVTRRNDRSTTGVLAAVSSGSIASVEGEGFGNAGHRLLASLRAVFKNIGMYSAMHPQVRDQSQRLVDNLSPLFSDLDCTEVQIVTVGRHYYVNGELVRPKKSAAKEMVWLTELTQRIGLVETRFGKDVNAQDITEFVNHLRETDRSNKQLVNKKFANIELFTPGQDAELGELASHLRDLPRFPLLLLYAEALGVIGQHARQLQHGTQPDPMASRRIVARAIDAIHNDPSGVLGLINLRPFWGSAVNRRLDAMIICLAIGKQLALTDHQLLALGTAALVRPIAFPNETWWERGSLSGKQAAEFAYRAEDPLEIITSFEGSAPTGRGVPPDYYGREVQPHMATLVIAVATGFIDLLQPGKSSRPFSPETALQLMISQAGEFWDPTLVCAMTHALGLYPPGTIVRLNSGDIAVVVRRPLPEQPIGRPSIRPVETSSNTTYDLALPEMASYKITGTVQRSACALNPLFVFLQ